uniref:Uncharacterized protein n=1 Tax=Anguilla anguilla TaxID=7936 RepID=A0A0E9QQM9_ANGAN
MVTNVPVPLLILHCQDLELLNSTIPAIVESTSCSNCI